MVGAILALAIGDPKIETNWYWPVGLLALSMVSFILGLEKCADAMDEDDVDKYLAWLLVYNLGSVAMFFGLATYIGLHYWPAVDQLNNMAGLPLLIAMLATAIVACQKWWKDILFLLFANQAVYEEYREELLGDRKPTRDFDYIIRLHGFFRRFQKKKGQRESQLDTESFTRLRPSPIHGVGVFAIREIPKGTNIFKDDRSEMIWLDRTEVQKNSGEIRRLYDDFCVQNNGKYGCPNGFNNLTVAWYINQPLEGHEPNVECRGDYDFFAARDIKAGEELTVDYSTYNEAS
jgi:hypothetical protein